MESLQFVHESITLKLEVDVHNEGSNFIGNDFQAVCNLLESRKIQTIPYRPQSNGHVER